MAARNLAGGRWNSCLIACVVVLVISLALIAFFINSYKKEECPKNHVCIPSNEYKKETDRTKVVVVSAPTQGAVPDRDRRVLNDQLYPPLNRTDRQTYDGVVRETTARNLNIPTTNVWDSYRLVGYLTSKDTEHRDAGGNSWKLMGRQKDRNEFDFYLVPTNNNYDIKVPLTPDVYVGQRFRDIYSIPKEVQFKSPMLNSTTYDFIELPKTDFSDQRYT